MVQTATKIIPPSDTSRVAEPEFRCSEQLEQTIPSVPPDRDAFSAVGTSPGHTQVSDNESTSLASDSPEQMGTPAIPAQCPSTPHPTLWRRADRFVEGTSPVLIRNAKILTGARNGTEVVSGGALLEKGVVLGVSYISRALTLILCPNLQVIEVDFARHCRCPFKFIRVFCPGIGGASDGNSIQAPILPWLRSLDGLNTHDDVYRFLSISHEDASNRRALCISHAVGAPGLNASDNHRKWRHMNHVCGENPSDTYSQTRMGEGSVS
ncbi:hypothetical protein B0H13DRAFT_2352696 [Mycena leptocephala]|nr:hypothetical protein B0H13DRAFT_2352696 [Mycena leptocephala]